MTSTPEVKEYTERRYRKFALYISSEDDLVQAEEWLSSYGVRTRVTKGVHLLPAKLEFLSSSQWVDVPSGRYLVYDEGGSFYTMYSTDFQNTFEEV